jgi:tripartite-type tricarboxylate transporter receptor subunit TctC
MTGSVIARRTLLAGAVFGAAMSEQVRAQAFPTKLVRIVVPQTPGGASDILARIVAQRLAALWGQAVIVDNKPGAGGVVGTEFVAKAPADGYTLLMSYAGTQAINPSLYAKLPFDSVEDFLPVATVASLPFAIVVHPSIPARNFQEFVALVRQKPGEITYGSSGNGSVNHLIGEMVNTEFGIRMVHVPYRGIAPAMNDLVSGQIQAAVPTLPSALPFVTQGSARALVVTSAKRAEAAPDIPTLAESGAPGFDVDPWFGLLAPAGVPAAIVTKINADVGKVLAEQEVRTLFKQQGATPLITTPEQFRAMLKSDVEKWAKVVKSSGAKLD